MTGLPLNAILILAWRNLWRNHRRTLIMLAAITVGVWAMIFMTALMRGMVDDMLLHGIRGLPGEVQIHHPDYRDDPSINNSMPPPSGGLLAALESPEVETWTSRVRVPAVISSERDSRGVVLRSSPAVLSRMAATAAWSSVRKWPIASKRSSASAWS